MGYDTYIKYIEYKSEIYSHNLENERRNDTKISKQFFFLLL